MSNEAALELQLGSSGPLFFCPIRVPLAPSAVLVENCDSNGGGARRASLREASGGHVEDKIIGLLTGEAVPLEKRIAAAIVLGEVGTKSVRATLALASALDSGIPLLQLRALEALLKVGSKRALPKIFPLLVSPSEDVRRAARAAVSSVGEEVVGTIRERLVAATNDERHALDAVLADVGGKDAFSTLVRGLATATGEAATSASLAVRQRVKDADARTRKSYLAETERFLASQAKSRGTSTAVAAAIKILGYLEDPRTVPTLLSYATSKTADALVKKEAIIAFRFALQGDRASAKVVDALTSAAESDDRTLAQTALHTLGSLALAPESIRKLGRLLASPDPERVRFVIDLLGRLPGGEAAKLLVEVLTELDLRYAEPAANALFGKEDAAPALARALLETHDRDRAWTLRNVLRPLAKKLPPSLRKELLTHATQRLSAGERGWEAALDVVRDADPEAVAEALRAMAQKFARARNAEKAQSVLSLLTKSDRATPDDRYLSASLALQKSALDTRAQARAADEALEVLASLADTGFDLSRALRKDRNLDLEHLYYVGFHLLEQRHPAGRELLEDVRARGGRSKVARLAKNKLELSGGA